MSEGVEHQALKQSAKHQLEEQGYKVSLEKQYRGFFIDVFGEKNGRTVAVECGGVTKQKLSLLTLFIDIVFNLPKKGQKATSISKDDLAVAWRRLLHSCLADVVDLHLDTQIPDQPYTLRMLITSKGKIGYELEAETN